MTNGNEQTKKVNDLMLALRRLTRSTLKLQHVIAGSIGLQATEAECIDYLQEMGPSTAGALAKATRLTTGAITNVIDRLERAGFVRREPDPADRRKVIVSFIPDQHQQAYLHYSKLASDVEQLFSNYNETELEFLLIHTKKLDEIYKKNALRVQEGEVKS